MMATIRRSGESGGAARGLGRRKKRPRRNAVGRRRDWAELLADPVTGGTIARAVDRKLGMFAAYRHLTRDDLVAQMTAAVHASWAQYDKRKAGRSTFVYRVVSFRLIDLARQLRRQAEHDALGAVVDVVEAPSHGEDDGLAGGLGDRGDQTVEEWLTGVYRAARRLGTADGRLRQGRRGFHWAQAVAVYALMGRMRLSARGCALLLAGRASFREAMGMARAPGYWWCNRARRLVSAKLGREVHTDNSRPVPGPAAGGE